MSGLILEIGQFAVDTACPVRSCRHVIQWVGDVVLDVGWAAIVQGIGRPSGTQRLTTPAVWGESGAAMVFKDPSSIL